MNQRAKGAATKASFHFRELSPLVKRKDVVGFFANNHFAFRSAPLLMNRKRHTIPVDLDQESPQFEIIAQSFVQQAANLRDLCVILRISMLSLRLLALLCGRARPRAIFSGAIEHHRADGSTRKVRYVRTFRRDFAARQMTPVAT
jgi:hypothetical protein